MVRSAPDDSLVIDSKTGIQIGCKYAYRCVSCGNIETTEHSYPFTEVKLDLSGAEYTPEEEYYRANG